MIIYIYIYIYTHIYIYIYLLLESLENFKKKHMFFRVKDNLPVLLYGQKLPGLNILTITYQ